MAPNPLMLTLDEKAWFQLVNAAHTLGISPEALAQRILLKDLWRIEQSQSDKSRRWKRSDRVILDKSTATRVAELGSIGEELAVKHLGTAGFVNIKNLNVEKRNHPYADLYAEQGGTKYFISVKSRNRFEATGRLNASYKISPRERVLAAKLPENAVAAWIAVSFDLSRAVYSCYFGRLDELEGKHGIKMTERAKSSYRCLAHDLPCPEDWSHLRNIPNRRKVL